MQSYAPRGWVFFSFLFHFHLQPRRRKIPSKDIQICIHNDMYSYLFYEMYVVVSCAYYILLRRRRRHRRTRTHKLTNLCYYSHTLYTAASQGK